MNRRGFLEIFGKSAAAIPVAVAIPVLAQELDEKTLPGELTYAYEMKQIIEHDMYVNSSIFKEAGVQSLADILQTLKSRNESKNNWVLTKLEPFVNHKSDCAVYNEPAYPNDKCNCGEQKLDEKITLTPAELVNVYPDGDWPVGWYLNMDD